MKKEDKVSVLMSVYKNDKPEWLEIAIDSVVNQTLKPDEIILYVDGQVSEELDNKISELCKKYSAIRLFRNEKNIGLGLTMQKGILECKNELIARMDSDDYSMPTRFEEELKFMRENDLDMVGSCVSEFIETIDNVVTEKKVPLLHDDIVKFSKSRNPFCHPTIMFKKSKVLESGNYQDMKLCEDYYLWVRMIQSGCKTGNIEKPLVLMRTSIDLYARRGGYKYFKSQKQLFKYMRKTKYIGMFTYLKNSFIRFCVQVLMPNKMRQKFYNKKLRNKK